MNERERELLAALAGNHRWELVANGARVSGGRGDALVTIHESEHARRQREQVGAIADLSALALLSTFPLGLPVRLVDLSSEERELLPRLPAGAATTTVDSVIRTLDRPVEVHAAIVSGRGWRTVIRRAGAFVNACTVVAVLESPSQNLTHYLWEANIAGIGVWIRTPAGTTEVLPAQPFAPHYTKPARWRFQERAYHAYLTNLSSHHNRDRSAAGFAQGGTGE